MKIAIVGTNFISDNFSIAASEVDGVELYAVYSRKLDTGRTFAAKYGIKKVYNDYSEMLSDTEIDAVYVASPNCLHPEHTVRALEAGKHVLCEKMLAPTYPEYLEMKATAERTGRVLLEAMRPTHDPFYDVLKQNLPRIGKVRRAHLEFCQYSSRYDRFKSGILTNAFDPTMKNSALADIGIYPVSVALMLFGEPIASVGSSVFLSNGFEGAGSIILTYPDKLVSVAYSKISDSTTPSIIEGELGSIHIDKLSAPTRMTLILRGERPAVIPTSSPDNNMIYEIRTFRDAVSGKVNTAPYTALSDSVMRLCDKIITDGGFFSRNE